MINMRFKGKAHVLGDDINTDYIIAGRLKFSTLDMKELAKHVMEDLDPNFYKKIKKGDFIVAGKNFGCGSSREQAPLAIKAAGISCVIAESFARIFFRNSINISLPVVEAKVEAKEGDILEVNLSQGKIFNKTRNKEFKAKPLPGVMIQILEAGGLVRYFKKHGGFQL